MSEQNNIGSNKRIAKNTLFLYLRMIIVMGIGLYTVRAILDLLGVVDYGIYNVVGGVVGMFQFLNGTLATSSQRYFSIELAKGDMKRLNQWFSLNILVFSIFILAFIIIAETVGLWFVNTQMTIPAERLTAANAVYQLSILSFCVSFLNVPYNALIIAHERMSAFAYISIVEAFLKLVIVYILTVISWDRLIVYGILMFVTSLGISSSYMFYNRFHFSESKFKPYWNKRDIIELLGFSGWHFLGTFSVVVRSQGINILLNLFFSPAINAARAVAFQVYNAVYQLSNNFFVAVKPQMYKSYAIGDLNGLNKLVFQSTVICTYLVSILVLPILTNTSYILGLWLKEIPDHAIVFTQLVLINGLIDASNGCTLAPALATGKIKKFQIIVDIPIFLNLPVSYIVLNLGADPAATMIVSIFFSVVTCVTKAYLLRPMISFPFGKYLVLLVRLLVASLMAMLIIYFLFYNVAEDIVSLIMQSVVSVIIITMLYITIVLSNDELNSVIKIVRSKCHSYKKSHCI